MANASHTCALLLYSSSVGRLVGPTVRQRAGWAGGRLPIGRAGSSEARDLISYQRIPLFCPLHQGSTVDYVENPTGWQSWEKCDNCTAQCVAHPEHSCSKQRQHMSERTHISSLKYYNHIFTQTPFQASVGWCKLCSLQCTGHMWRRQIDANWYRSISFWQKTYISKCFPVQFYKSANEGCSRS